MKLAKKITTIGTIVSTCIASLLLIVILFLPDLISDTYFDVVLTFGTIAVGGFFAINSINMISKNKVIGWVSLGLIVASVVLIILSFWISFNSKMYQNITLSLGLLSVLFNIIVSSGLSLGKSKLVWQIIVYIVVGVTDLLATLAMFDVFYLVDILAFFLMLVILSIVGVIILKVFSKKIVSDMVEDSKNMIKISKLEYQTLVEKAAKYDEMITKMNESKK